MSQKYLPIKIFEKRKDFDDRNTEGGGDGREASWVLHGEELHQRSELLTRNVKEIRSSFEVWNKKESPLPMLVTTTIEINALAKSHRGKIVDILESDGKDNVIGILGNRQLLSKITSDDVLQSIENVFNDEENQAKLISSINDMEVFRPYLQGFEEGHTAYRVKLCNYNSFDMNNIAKIIFERQCQEKGVKIESKVRYTTDMTIYRVVVESVEQLNEIGEFEGIYLVEKTYPVVATMDGMDSEIKIGVKEPREDGEYPIVGVLDTGIADISYLQKWKDKKEFTNYPEEYQDNSHGTFVAGIIEYGDELNGSNIAALDGVKIFNAVVYPDLKKEEIYPEELVEHIREAIERNSQIKIWNLSLGTNQECEVDEFSDFGMALDNIQDENNILLVKSVGNCSDFLKNRSKSRVSQSADSVRSLVVGAIAEIQGEYDYAEPNMPSPFTRVGPGPANIVKPDLVYYGGNAGVKQGKMTISGVPSFGLDESIQRMVGTSFSTPWVTRIASELNFLMSEEFDPLMIRALMIHYAKYPSDTKMRMVEKVNQMGFGMPIGAQDILYNSPDEITLILRDTLDKGSFIEMFDFPYPTSLVDENGFFRGQIILTMVNKTIVDDKQAGEYCQSNIDVYFGTYETEKERDISKPIIKNPRGVDVNKNILSDNLYSARVKGVHPNCGFERECTLIKYGKKFHPVKKYAIDLYDMTPSNKEKWLPSTRKWYLKIEGLYRDFIEREAERDNYQLSQEYCLILTIKDPDKNEPVYNEVTQQLTNRNFIHHDVIVRNNIQVTTENN